MSTGVEKMDAMLDEMRSIRSQIEADEQELSGQLELIRARKKRISAMIRAGEAQAKPKQPRQVRQKGIRGETEARIIKAFDKLGGHVKVEGIQGSFTTSDLVSASGLAQSTVSRAMPGLRDKGIIRQVGKIKGGPTGTPVYVVNADGH